MSAAFAQPLPSQTDALDGIGRAFFATLHRDGSPAYALAGALVTLLMVILLVRWVQQEVRRERLDQDAIDANHAATMSEVSTTRERREWVRVAAHLRLTLQHKDAHRGFTYEECETRSVSGDAITFLCHAPPAPGIPLHFTVDLGEKWPRSLRGVVVRTEPPAYPDARSLVVVKLGPITAREREHLVRWVVHEETQELARARQGRLCPCCARPLAEDAGERHSTCALEAAKESSRPAA